jgi:hypothetical protein
MSKINRFLISCSLIALLGCGGSSDPKKTFVENLIKAISSNDDTRIMELYATKENLISAVMAINVKEVNKFRGTNDIGSQLDANWTVTSLKDIQNREWPEDNKSRFVNDVRSQLYNAHPEVDWKNISVRQYECHGSLSGSPISATFDIEILVGFKTIKISISTIHNDESFFVWHRSTRRPAIRIIE